MTIELGPHDPRWHELYETAAAEIRGALGPAALSVHHVGSTAIPVIEAKPVIDILVLVRSYDPESLYRPQLEATGFALDHRDDTTSFDGSRD